MKCLAIVAVLLNACVFAWGQDLSRLPRNEYGIVAGFTFNDHTSQFTHLGSYPSCCPEFTGGSGTGPYFGLFATLPLSPMWRLQAQLVFSDESGTLTDDETSWVADLRDSARVVQATFTHTIDASLSSIGLEPRILFRPFGALDIMLGGRVAYVVASSFHQTEVLTQPADYGEYLGAGAVWVDTQAEIPEAPTIAASVLGGVRYVLPLNARGTLFLAPEVTYLYPITQVASETNWKVAQLRAGIEFGWSPAPTEPPPPEPPPPVRIEPQKVSASIAFMQRTSSQGASLRQLDSIVVDDTSVVDQMPLLTYVYFDAGSSVVPDRFVSAARYAFDHPDEIPQPEAPRSAMGLIARRLVDLPSATVTVVGNTSDITNDEGLFLAESRATAIKLALMNLGIDGSRITIQSRRFPSVPTKTNVNSETELAEEENRRVELIPSDPRILNPINVRSVRRAIIPDTVFVVSTVDATGPVGITGSVTSDRQIWDLEKVPHLGIPRIDTNAFAASSFIPRDGSITQNPIVANLHVIDTLNVEHIKADSLRMVKMSSEQRKYEKKVNVKVERYFLILFAFNDATLSADHKQTLESAKSSIKPNSTVKIYGKTDMMGTDEYNVDLSRRRAEEVAKVLGIKDYTVEAMGETAPFYGNTQPEGRAYNRTVIVEVTTPVE